MTEFTKQISMCTLYGTYQRKDLKDRMIEISPGIIVQRDMLSAYIIEHTNTTLSSINKR